MTSSLIKSHANAVQLIYAVFASALIYATIGLFNALRSSSLHIAAGAGHALPLLAAGLAPIGVIVLFFTFNRDLLAAGKRRPCLVGAALTSLILLPLLRLAF